MKLQLNSIYIKIAAASLFVIINMLVSAMLIFGDDKKEIVKQEEVKQESVVETTARQEPATPRELDDMHSSWLFSSSQSAGLVDSESGFQTVTIGE